VVGRYYPPDQSIQEKSGATIGATKPAPSTGQASGQVPEVRESDVDAFLQSAAFRRLVGNRDIQSALLDANASAFFTDPHTSATLRRIVSDPQIADDLPRIFSDPELAAIARVAVDEKVAAMLADPKVAAVLRSRDAVAILADPAVAAALEDSRTPQLLANPRVRELLQQ
jgi:hypothetical protein